MPLDEYRAANRNNWDDRVPIHWDSEQYKIQKFIDDPEYISDVVQFDIDRDELGDVSGKTLLHLQCHIGHDTLSWARLGADVTGIDFSEPAIDAARRLSTESGTQGEFIVAELYDSPKVLPGRQFDVVYTSIGATVWLPDINDWAEVVNQFLKPGGTFYVFELHPMMLSVSQEDHGDLIVWIGHTSRRQARWETTKIPRMPGLEKLPTPGNTISPTVWEKPLTHLFKLVYRSNLYTNIRSLPTSPCRY